MHNRRSEANGRKQRRNEDIRWSRRDVSASAENDRTVVKCIGAGLQRDPRPDWPGLIIKPLDGARRRAPHLCDGNRDRSRMQTALERVARGNGDARALLGTPGVARDTCVDFSARSMYRPGPEARDRSPKNVHPCPSASPTVSVAPGIEKSLARWRRQSRNEPFDQLPLPSTSTKPP